MKSKTRHLFGPLLFSTFAFGIALPSALQAQNITWQNPVDGLWSNSNNWTPVGLPGASSDVRFSPNAVLTSQMDIPGLDINSFVGLGSSTANVMTIDLNDHTLSITPSSSSVIGFNIGSNTTSRIVLQNGSVSIDGGEFRIGVRTSTTSDGGVTGASSLDSFSAINLTNFQVGYQAVSGHVSSGVFDMSNVANGTLDVVGGANGVSVGNSFSTSTSSVSLGSNWAVTLGRTDNRTDFIVGRKGAGGSNNQVSGSFTQAGGTFTGHFETVRVGSNAGGDTMTSPGTVALSSVNNGLFGVASLLEIGVRMNGSVALGSGWDITVGVDTSNRAPVSIGTSVSQGGLTGTLTATNADLSGFVGAFQIGVNTNIGAGGATGNLTLSGPNTTVNLDVTSFQVGVGRVASGTVDFSTAASGTLVVGGGTNSFRIADTLAPPPPPGL